MECGTVCIECQHSEFKEELPEILGTTHPITTPLQRSALLLAWQRCRQSTEQAKDPPQAAPSQASEAATPASSWSETFPPKLTSDVVLAMKQKFKQNYPAEILLPETMPSLRLLSLMHHQKTKKEFRWVPWKYRISQAKSDELTIGKTSRLAKAEGLQLHSLLLDSPPEIQIENGAMGMHALRQTFETYSYAMAMLELVSHDETILYAFHQPHDYEDGQRNGLAQPYDPGGTERR